jgi:hypothetical protein
MVAEGIMTELFPVAELLTFAVFLAGPVWLGFLSAAQDWRQGRTVDVDTDAFADAEVQRELDFEAAQHRIDETAAGFPSTAVC